MILEDPGLIFEVPSLHFGGFWNDLLEIFDQNAEKAKNARNACQNKTSITNVSGVGGRRCFPEKLCTTLRLGDIDRFKPSLHYRSFQIDARYSL